jgi:hypothetical protein
MFNSDEEIESLDDDLDSSAKPHHLFHSMLFAVVVFVVLGGVGVGIYFLVMQVIDPSSSSSSLSMDSPTSTSQWETLVFIYSFILLSSCLSSTLCCACVWA